MNNNLTPRETAVLHWAARGLFYKEIGRMLNISEQTVKNHAQILREKLHAYNITHAVAIAIQQGVI